MITESATLTRGDLERLAVLIGAQWRFVAGETLTHHLFTPVDVIIETTRGGVRIVSEIFESAFEGELNTYAKLSVSKDLSSLTKARRDGNVYVHHQREVIENVLVVRDTVTEVLDGETAWTYTTDVGVVFRLSGGMIAVAKASHHTEMLTVEMTGSSATPDIPDRVGEWQDDLATEHRSSRRFIPLRELLSA